MNNDLKQLAEAIMDANSRIADETAHVKDLYAQAKSKGYDVKILRKVIKLIEGDKVEAEKEVLVLTNTYLSNLEQGELF